MASSGGATDTLVVSLPEQWFAWDRPAYRVQSFQGTLLTDKADGTGTYFRRHRNYDPRSGRFTQEDPIGLAGGLNLYGLAGGDPVNFSDPFGLCPFCLFEAAATAYDLIDLAVTAVRYMRGEASGTELGVTAFGLGAGIVAFGGGYGKSARTTLYRSVSAAEHADIVASGVLRAGPNSLSTGKWFWESAESAAIFGSRIDGAGNFRIIEATFPRSAADQFMRIDRLDGIGPARHATWDQIGKPSLRPIQGSP